MTLRLYNTLTRRKDALEELPGFDPNNVRMYVCGPTVYDYAHIGNARPVIVFDVLYRLLKHLYEKDGGKVTYVRNITDIDDKINARAAETAAAKGIPVEQARAEITAATAQQYMDDVAALGCLPPDETPRATEYVGQMIAMIERLVAAGNAYVAEGHVLFDVSSKSDYGKLARRSLDEMMAGARVEVAPYKKNPMDFVLWKPSDATTPGWPSPWGRGRPGWHIECSAMGEALLGETFDIHGGGIDLMFPHHENEIAQSESVHHGHPLARIWMHNGFLQVEGEKMAKSLGNFITIRDLLKDWPGEVLRFNMLRTHYRQPIDWTEQSLQESERILARWRNRLLSAPAYDGCKVDMDEAFCAHLSDDLNTPAAISRLHELFNAGHWADTTAKANEQIGSFGFGNVPGVTGFIDESDVLVNKAKAVAALALIGIDPLVEREPPVAMEEIDAQVAARNAARKAKDFKEADRIRDELLAKGIVLKDGPAGTTWEVKR